MRNHFFEPFPFLVRQALKSRVVLTSVVAFVACGCFFLIAPNPARAQLKDAPELVGGVDWFNTDKPVRLEDLRGRIVLLDFWTFC